MNWNVKPSLANHIRPKSSAQRLVKLMVTATHTFLASVSVVRTPPYGTAAALAAARSGVRWEPAERRPVHRVRIPHPSATRLIKWLMRLVR